MVAKWQRIGKFDPKSYACFLSHGLQFGHHIDRFRKLEILSEGCFVGFEIFKSQVVVQDRANEVRTEERRIHFDLGMQTVFGHQMTDHPADFARRTTVQSRESDAGAQPGGNLEV